MIATAVETLNPESKQPHDLLYQRAATAVYSELDPPWAFPRVITTAIYTHSSVAANRIVGRESQNWRKDTPTLPLSLSSATGTGRTVTPPGSFFVLPQIGTPGERGVWLGGACLGVSKGRVSPLPPRPAPSLIEDATHVGAGRAGGVSQCGSGGIFQQRGGGC